MSLFEILNDAENGWKTDVALSDKVKATCPFFLPHAVKSFKRHDILGSIMKQSFQINSIQAELIVLNAPKPFSIAFKPTERFTGYVYDIFTAPFGGETVAAIPTTYSGVYHEVSFEQQPGSFEVSAGLTCFLIIVPNSAMIVDFIKISPQLTPFHYKSFTYGEIEIRLFNRLLNKKNAELEQSIILHRLMLSHLQQLESLREKANINPLLQPEIISFGKAVDALPNPPKEIAKDKQIGTVNIKTPPGDRIKQLGLTSDKQPSSTTIKKIISISRKLSTPRGSTPVTTMGGSQKHATTPKKCSIVTKHITLSPGIQLNKIFTTLAQQSAVYSEDPPIA